jgi:hypothetical protein
MPNIRLKVAIMEAGITQRTLSDLTGVGESILSAAVRGRYVLDHEQRERIRVALMARGAKDPFADAEAA